LLDDVAKDLVRRVEEHPPAVAFYTLLSDSSDRVHVAAHEMSADPGGKLERPFQVHFRSDRKLPQVRDPERFSRDIGGELVFLQVDNGETDPVHADAFAQGRAAEYRACGNR